MLYVSVAVLRLQARYLPSSHTMAMAARTMRSLSCSPSVPTAIREFAIEVGNSIALMEIIYRGRKERDSSKRSGRTEAENNFSMAPFSGTFRYEDHLLKYRHSPRTLHISGGTK